MPTYPWPFQAVTQANFLSGIFAWTTTPTRPAGLAADTTPIRVKSIWVTNTTGVQQTVTVTDGNGKAITGGTMAVPAHSGPLSIDGMDLEAFDGLLVSSTVGSGVQGQVEGWT